MSLVTSHSVLTNRTVSDSYTALSPVGTFDTEDGVLPKNAPFGGIVFEKPTGHLARASIINDHKKIEDKRARLRNMSEFEYPAIEEGTAEDEESEDQNIRFIDSKLNTLTPPLSGSPKVKNKPPVYTNTISVSTYTSPRETVDNMVDRMISISADDEHLSPRHPNQGFFREPSEMTSHSFLPDIVSNRNIIEEDIPYIIDKYKGVITGDDDVPPLTDMLTGAQPTLHMNPANNLRCQNSLRNPTVAYAVAASYRNLDIGKQEPLSSVDETIICGNEIEQINHPHIHPHIHPQMSGFSIEDFNTAIKIFTLVRDQMQLAAPCSNTILPLSNISQLIQSASIIQQQSSIVSTRPVSECKMDILDKDMICRQDGIAGMCMRQTSRVDSFKYHVAFLVSQPLLHQMGIDLQTVAPLNVAYEEQKIKEAFGDCNFKVRYIRIIATINNLRTLISAGTKILHYCGHGIPKSLIFESEQEQYAGMSKQLRPEDLRDLINAGRDQQQQSPLRLVFVSACHSEDAGKAFVKAGAAHVVAVRRSEELHDDAAATFTSQFYYALVTGKTVQQAFDIAVQTIATQFGDDSFIKNESNKFILLPKKSPHNEILFPAMPANNDETPELVDETRERPPKKFPTPPDEWVSRFKDMHELMASILANRLTVISCEKGLGKTALLCKTLQYMWDRSMKNGFFMFDIYQLIRKFPDNSLATIVSREITVGYQNCSSNVKLIKPCKSITTLAQQLSKTQYVLVFEDIDQFEYAHLASDQRIDTFIEDLLSNCEQVKIVLTLGSPVGQCTFLHNLDKHIINLKPLLDSESLQLFTRIMRKQCSTEILNTFPVKQMASYCKGYPHLIKFAAAQFQKVEDLTNPNRRKTIRVKVEEELDKLRGARYYKELTLDELPIGGLRQKIRDREGQQLWKTMFGQATRGLLITFLASIKEQYRQYVEPSFFSIRPLWEYHELEFLQMELLPFLASETKAKFIPPSSVIENLETDEISLDFDDYKLDNGKSFISTFLRRKKKQSKSRPTSSRYGNNNERSDTNLDENLKLPIEVFAKFFRYWKELWKTMLDPKIWPFYFRKDGELRLIAGMIHSQRAKNRIAHHPQGTFLIRFSKSNPQALVLVVSRGKFKSPSQHKITMKPGKDSANGLVFEYPTERKGIYRSESLYDLLSSLSYLQHLWYRKRGFKNDCIEYDKRKILKNFRAKSEAFKL